MTTFLKVVLLVLAVLALSAFLGCGGAIPFLVIGGILAVAAIGISGLFTVVTTVLGLVLGLVGLVVGLVLLATLAPVLIPILLLALPVIIVVAVVMGLCSLCTG